MSNWLTFADIYGQVSDLIDDASTDRVTLAKKLVNHAYRDMMNADTMCPLWFRRKRGSFNTVAGTQAYTDNEAVGGATAGVMATAGITDLGRIVSMSVGGRPCRGADLNYVDENAVDFWDTSNREDYPKYYLHEVSRYSAVAVTGPPAGNRTRLFLNTLNFFYTPNSIQAVRLTYEQVFADLSADTDVPLLPDHYHQALVPGAMTMMESFGKSALAAMWSSMYLAQKNAMIIENRRQINNYEVPAESGVM